MSAKILKCLRKTFRLPHYSNVLQCKTCLPTWHSFSETQVVEILRVYDETQLGKFTFKAICLFNVLGSKFTYLNRLVAIDLQQV